MRLFEPVRTPANAILQLPQLAVAVDCVDSRLVYAGDRVSAVENLAPGAVADAVQATSTYQPLYNTDGMRGCPGLKFRHDGSNGSGLTIADSAGLDHAAFDLFVVANREIDMGGTETLVGKLTSFVSANEFRLIVQGAVDTPQVAITSDGTNTTLKNAALGAYTVALNKPVIYNSNYEGSRLELSVNDSVFTAVTDAVSVFNGSAALSIGSVLGTGGEPFAGTIAAVYFFTRKLSAWERRFVHEFLSRRYMIGLNLL